MIRLYGCANANIPLKEAIAQCADYLNDAIGLFYSPQWCKFGKLQEDDSELRISDSQGPLPLEFVFEARVFNTTAELRWLKSEIEDKAVLLSERAVRVPEWEVLEPITDLESLSQTYSLWGRGVEKQPENLRPGWSRLAEARIGKLDVPLPGVLHLESVQLVAREYIGKVDECGNFAVVEERLIELKKQKIVTRNLSNARNN